MASLSQKRGVWYLWIYANRRRKGISLGTKNRLLAEELASRILEDKSTCNVASTIKLSDLYSRWKHWHFHFSHKYIETCDIMWRLFIKHFGDIDCNRLKAEHLLDYLRLLSDKGYSDAYINNRLKNIRAVFSWALKQNLIETTPFTDQVQIPKGRNRVEFLSYSEITRLIRSADSEALYQAYIEFLLATGCRRGEFYNLRWSDINEHFIEFNGKTGRRTFPQNPKINEILTKIRTNSKRIDNYVYTDIKEGKHPSLEETLGRMVKRYIRKAGLKDSYTTHTLRHTFASHLVLKGIPIYTVSKLMGHSNVKTTERYTHLAPERLNVDISYF